jgi:carboxypeptidase Q
VDGCKSKGFWLAVQLLCGALHTPVSHCGGLGMTLVTARADCGADCASFEQVGISTPPFKQDPLDYETKTHHTNMDTYEHLIPEDLRQAAIIVATMLYNKAMRAELLPRMPLPQ